MASAALFLVPLVDSPASATDAGSDRTSVDPGGGALGDVIYTQRRRVAADGSVSLTAEGSNVLTLHDGSEFTITSSRLEAPDGRRFAIIGDIAQESDDSDVVYTLQIVEDHALHLSEEELTNAWLDVHSEATDEELAAFAARRAEADLAPAAVTEIDEVVIAWLETAEDDALATVWLRLAEDPPLDLPDVGPGLMDTDPTFVLDELEDRLIAVEARKTEVADLQAEVIASLDGHGASLTGRLWSVNAVQVLADAAAIRGLAEDPAVARIELDGGMVEETANRGEEIRLASQVKQYLDSGLDGSLGSGRTAYDTIVVGLADVKIDVDHPAWDDCGFVTCDSRLLRQEDYSGGGVGWWFTDPVGGTDIREQHGNYVASQLLADLTDGQDPTIPGSTERKARTGMSPESSFVAINVESPSSIDLFKLAVWWFDANLNILMASPAELRTRVCDQDVPSVCYVHDTTDPDAHRIKLTNAFAGHRWRVDITGLDVPLNMDPNDHYYQQRRTVYAAYLWEDRDRDDADGPDTGVW